MSKWLPLLLLVGCSPPPAVQEQVLQSLHFAREEAGVSLGFDLDGVDSAEDDGTGCGHGDYEDPWGHAGVDNAMASLMPILELTEARVLEELIQFAINNGSLLMMLQLQGLDDVVADDGVDITLLRGVGVPDIGNDGLIAPGQTFDVAPDTVPSRVDDVAVVDGVLVAAGFTVDLPITIFDVDMTLTALDAVLRMELTEDGGAGFFAGRFPYQQLIDGLTGTGIDDGLEEALPTILANNADLDSPGGPCSALSVTLQFDATSAFFFEE